MTLEGDAIDNLLDILLLDTHGFDREHVAEIVRHNIEDLRYLYDAHQHSPTLKEAESKFQQISIHARALKEALTDLSPVEHQLMKQHAQTRSRPTTRRLIGVGDKLAFIEDRLDEWHEITENLFERTSCTPGGENPLRALAAAATDTLETIGSLIPSRSGRPNFVARLMTTPADYAVHKAADLLFMAGRLSEIDGSARAGAPLYGLTTELWTVAVDGNYQPDLADRVKRLARRIKVRLSNGELFTDLTTHGRHAASGGK